MFRNKALHAYTHRKTSVHPCRENLQTKPIAFSRLAVRFPWLGRTNYAESTLESTCFNMKGVVKLTLFSAEWIFKEAFRISGLKYSFWLLFSLLCLHVFMFASFINIPIVLSGQGLGWGLLFLLFVLNIMFKWVCFILQRVYSFIFDSTPFSLYSLSRLHSLTHTET